MDGVSLLVDLIHLFNRQLLSASYVPTPVVGSSGAKARLESLPSWG